MKVKVIGLFSSSLIEKNNNKNFFFFYVGPARLFPSSSRLSAIQRYFRHRGNDSMAGEKSLLYGKSVSNQI